RRSADGERRGQQAVADRRRALLTGAAAARKAARDAGLRFFLAVRIDVVDVDVAAYGERPLSRRDLESGRRRATAERGHRSQCTFGCTRTPFLPLYRCHGGSPGDERLMGSLPGHTQERAPSTPCDGNPCNAYVSLRRLLS